MYVFSSFFPFLLSFVFQIFKFYFLLYFFWNIYSNTCCFQILIAREASSTVENANGYDSLTTDLLSYVLQFSDALPLDGLFNY